MAVNLIFLWRRLIFIGFLFLQLESREEHQWSLMCAVGERIDSNSSMSRCCFWHKQKFQFSKYTTIWFLNFFFKKSKMNKLKVLTCKVFIWNFYMSELNQLILFWQYCYHVILWKVAIQFPELSIRHAIINKSWNQQHTLLLNQRVFLFICDSNAPSPSMKNI